MALSIEIKGLQDCLPLFATEAHHKARSEAIRKLGYDARDMGREKILEFYNIKKAALNKRLTLSTYMSGGERAAKLIAVGYTAGAIGRSLQLSDFFKTKRVQGGVFAEIRKGKPVTFTDAVMRTGRNSNKKVTVWYRKDGSRGPRGGVTKTVGTISVSNMFDNDGVRKPVQEMVERTCLAKFQEEYQKLVGP